LRFALTSFLQCSCQVCEIYFRVLKSAEASAAADDRPLLGPTLDGLARIAHLIDYEVVADILEARTA